MGPARRFLVVLPAILGLMLLSAFAIRWGVADALVRSASRDINAWAATQSNPSLETWLGVRADLERARRWAPSDPQAPELLGLMHLRRSGRPEYTELALEYFLGSVERRPSSPYTWVNVVAARYQLGMTEAPFERLLLQPWRLGPSEPETQRLVVDLGLAMWNEVGRDTQSAVKQAVAVAMRRNPLETLQISERRGRLSLACRHVGADNRLKETRWVPVCADVVQ